MVMILIQRRRITSDYQILIHPYPFPVIYCWCMVFRLGPKTMLISYALTTLQTIARSDNHLFTLYGSLDDIYVWWFPFVARQVDSRFCCTLNGRRMLCASALCYLDALNRAISIDKLLALFCRLGDDAIWAASRRTNHVWPEIESIFYVDSKRDEICQWTTGGSWAMLCVSNHSCRLVGRYWPKYVYLFDNGIWVH